MLQCESAYVQFYCNSDNVNASMFDGFQMGPQIFKTLFECLAIHFGILLFSFRHLIPKLS